MNLWAIQLPIPLALAIVATIGYLFGRRTPSGQNDAVVRSRRELRRAQLVAAELEKIAWDLRKGLARHHSSVSRFRERVGRLNDQRQDAAWKELCREAEEILKPTLRLAAQIASAHEELRQQSANLMTFTEVRTDPLTGVNNRRGLDDALAGQFAMMNRYGTRFSVGMFDIDHFKKINDQEGHLFGDRTLQRLARIFDECVRETDVNGASIFAERLRAKIEAELPLTVSGGVTEAFDGDTQDSLIARADTALYQAKTLGRNCIVRHVGDGSEPATAEPSVLEG